MRIVKALVVVSVLSAVPWQGSALPPAGPRCRVAEPTGTPVAPAADGIKVGSLNVLHGLDHDADADYPGASTLVQRTQMQARQIAIEALDVVGLQEVSVFQAETDDPPTFVAEELAAALATETGERWWSCWFLANPYFPVEPDISEGGGGPISDFEAGLVSSFTGGPYAVFKEGIAVVSRYEIVASEGLHLPGRLPVEIPLCFAEGDLADPLSSALCAATAGFERRAAIWARVDTPDGVLDITSTHLAHDITSASDASSLQQAAAVVAFAEAHVALGPADMTFITCDCNAQPSDAVPVVGAIEAAGYVNTFTAPCPGPGCTAGADVIVTHGEAAARAMTERLDYVFARAGSPCMIEGRVFTDDAVAYDDAHGPGWLWPSDHLGVAADVADVCIA